MEDFFFFLLLLLLLDRVLPRSRRIAIPAKKKSIFSHTHTRFIAPKQPSKALTGKKNISLLPQQYKPDGFSCSRFKINVFHATEARNIKKKNFN